MVTIFAEMFKSHSSWNTLTITLLALNSTMFHPTGENLISLCSTEHEYHRVQSHIVNAVTVSMTQQVCPNCKGQLWWLIAVSQWLGLSLQHRHLDVFLLDLLICLSKCNKIKWNYTTLLKLHSWYYIIATHWLVSLAHIKIIMRWKSVKLLRVLGIMNFIH